MHRSGPYRYTIFGIEKQCGFVVFRYVSEPGQHGARTAAVDAAGRARYLSVMAGPISSPCKSVCAIDAATSLCAGCGRTLKEIASWGRLTEPERLAIMQGLPERMRRTAAAAGPA